ncbi:MAG: Hsp70 family protein, partial [Polyangiales bacterium]
MAVESRFLVGIDLGTTHTVVAYADTLEAKTGAPPIRLFEVEQLVAPGEVEARPMLPSARYLPAESELAAGDLALPWDRGEDVVARGVVGQLALGLGAKTPGRLVASAKSWLSHGAVDRTAKILPWGAPSEVTKVSPVEASASYLAHLRAAWDHRFPNAPLATQEVVLTVPASFDEGARALTVQAAKDAGLKVRLVEEPQAAFYAWLDAHRDGLEGALGQTRLAVVVDVGGGTTDLTLIQVELRESGPRLTRVAVGEHLMLGGDNMDLTLAKNAEARLGKTLGAARFTQLVQQCRLAKERLLMPDAPENVRVTVLGSGSKLVGGAQSVT